jgi:tRNA pseudouridine55 synthase
MFGLLNVLKPAGCTSRDVVNSVQRLVKPAKVGHAGTLDPLACGVLLIGVGPATRLVPYLQQLRKRYAATFLLGRRSDTDDIEGEIVSCESAVQPTRAAIEAATPAFVGEILQRPPDYSAVKVSGQRAYALARRGEAVQLQARPVSVYSIHIQSYEYPELRLDIECGSGTYVRAIGRDLAKALGNAAVMSELTRRAIGDFRIEEAASVEAIREGPIERFLLPPIRALQGYPVVHVSSEQAKRILNGQFLQVPNHGIASIAVAVSSANELIAILRPYNPDQLRPDVVFPIQA